MEKDSSCHLPPVSSGLLVEIQGSLSHLHLTVKPLGTWVPLDPPSRSVCVTFRIFLESKAIHFHHFRGCIVLTHHANVVFFGHGLV